jgi:hypothetical protein
VSRSRNSRGRSFGVLLCFGRGRVGGSRSLCGGSLCIFPYCGRIGKMSRNSYSRNLGVLFLGRGRIGGSRNSRGGSLGVCFIGRGRIGDESEIAW